MRLVSRTDSEAGDASFTQASSPVSVMLTVSPFTPLSCVCSGADESPSEFVAWAVGLPGHLMAEDIDSCQ